jgi:hypothetical protein
MTKCPHRNLCWCGDTCGAVDYCKHPLIEKSWNGTKAKECSQSYKDLKEKQVAGEGA